MTSSKFRLQLGRWRVRVFTGGFSGWHLEHESGYHVAVSPRIMVTWMRTTNR